MGTGAVLVEKDGQGNPIDLQRARRDGGREADVSGRVQTQPLPASGYYEWKSTSQVQDRMPVLLQPRDFDRWLAATAGTELLKPAANDYLQVWPVSRRVNSSRAPGDDSTLIEAIQ
jgi:hypothetical protein